jgi:release factor glutamine methyltransferase
MQLRDALRSGVKTLLDHDVPSARLAAELLLMHALGRDRNYIHSHPEGELASEDASRYFALIRERTSGKPTQYITGHQEFWGLDFEVTPDVLIPRPETEHVIERVLELARSQGFEKDLPPRIVDVGTGSGCIALALASELPLAQIYALDISRPALAVAKRNAARLGMEERVGFLESDLLGRLLTDEFLATFDFVVSNPPYVGRDELQSLQREVRDFEPRIAWGGLERGDEFYCRLFPQAHRLLKPGGYVVVEIGYTMGEAVVALLGAEWNEIEVMPDYAGIQRVVGAMKA